MVNHSFFFPKDLAHERPEVEIVPVWIENVCHVLPKGWRNNNYSIILVMATLPKVGRFATLLPQ